jgi:CheY-like chemotaxis protein
VPRAVRENGPRQGARLRFQEWAHRRSSPTGQRVLYKAHLEHGTKTGVRQRIETLWERCRPGARAEGHVFLRGIAVLREPVGPGVNTCRGAACHEQVITSRKVPTYGPARGISPMARRVLIVEDEVLTRAMLAEMVDTGGFEVICAENAESALRLAAVKMPDVVVVDHHLTGITGAEFIRWLQACPIPQVRGIPLIGISGRVGSEKDLVGAGACCFLHKPVDEYQLMKAIRWALDVYWRDDHQRPPIPLARPELKSSHNE